MRPSARETLAPDDSQCQVASVGRHCPCGRQIERPRSLQALLQGGHGRLMPSVASTSSARACLLSWRARSRPPPAVAARWPVPAPAGLGAPARRHGLAHRCGGVRRPDPRPGRPSSRGRGPAARRKRPGAPAGPRSGTWPAARLGPRPLRATYHNMSGFGRTSSTPVASAFEAYPEKAVGQHDPVSRNEMLVKWEHAPAARLAHPRADHLLPLVVVAGAAGQDGGQRVFVDHVLQVAMASCQFPPR